MASRNLKPKAKNGAQPRASITFPPELYQTLEGLAKQHKVSIAWVVRDAVEKYVADKWPLFASVPETSRE
jgi:predicted DNA-binding protein